MSHIEQTGDRFIPSRQGMEINVSQYLLTKENVEPQSGLLAETIFGSEQGKILSFKSKAPAPRESSAQHRVLYSANSAAAEKSKATRFISQKAERVLDAPGIVDDYYLNLIDWSSTNYVALALQSTVYLWNGATGATTELMSFDEKTVCSVNWHADGKYIGVGLCDGTTQLWDAETQKALRNLKGHSARVGALSWANSTLTTGSKDSTIINHDVRIAESMTSRLTAHSQEVCGLKWNADGTQLASGANDNVVNVWDANTIAPKFSFTEHTASVKALAWAPFQKDLLATGGGSSDRSIKFWNTTTGALLNTIDAQSQVSSLVWSKDSGCKEIFSSHGFSQNQVCVWQYPTLAKTAELRGHSSRILGMAQSPCGSVIASAGADESLRFWKVSDNTPAKTVSKKVEASGVSAVRHIR